LGRRDKEVELKGAKSDLSGWSPQLASCGGVVNNAAFASPHLAVLRRR